jgi:NDP-sugar pyrophosphorylase family protein
MGEITTAVVLAAGEGSRLRPLTRYRPKPMLPVANRPIIEYVIDALLASSVSEIIVVVGHQHTRIQDHLMQRYPDAEITYVRQPNQLGSGDAVAQVIDGISGPFVVVNGDNVIDPAMVRETVQQYQNDDAAATVAVSQSDKASEYGTVCTENERITTILEQNDGTEQGRINVGVYIFDESIFTALDRTAIRRGELSLTNAIPSLQGEVVPAVPDGVWYDPAYPWDLLAISEQLQAAHPELVAGPEKRPAIAETARVHDTAVVEDDVLVGPGCEVSPGAVLRRGTCLHSDVRVGANSVVKRSLVGADTTVGPNSVLRDTVVGEEVRLGEATTAPGGPADFVVQDNLYRDKQLGSLVSDRADIGANVSLAPGVRIGPNARVPHGNTVPGSISVESGVIR